MLVRRTILANSTDNFPVNGTNFSLIKGASLRVNLLNNGARIFSSEMYVGMAATFGQITTVEIESDIEQTVEYWIGDSSYSYTNPAEKASALRVKSIDIKTGVNRVLNAEHNRTDSTLVFDNDVWLGGDDLTVGDDDTVTNALLLPAGTEFKTQSTAAVDVFVSSRNERIQAQNIIPHGQNGDNVQDQSSEFHHRIDFEIPAHLVGQPLTLHFDYTTRLGGSAPYYSGSESVWMRWVYNDALSGAFGRYDSFKPIGKGFSGSSKQTINTKKSYNYAFRQQRVSLYFFDANAAANQAGNVTINKMSLEHETWGVIHAKSTVISEVIE